MERKKILIIGPFGDRGGREVEVGFITNILEEKNEVFICSTEFISSKSQIFNFVNQSQINSFLNYLYTSFMYIKFFSVLSYFKNRKLQEPPYYSKNNINKKFFNLERKIHLYIQELTFQFDLIFISAQLNSNYIKIIVDYSFKYDKPVIFRTTGKFYKTDFDRLPWLSKVTFFIHHSTSSQFESNFVSMRHKHKFVDQCALFESELLQIPLIKRKAKTFLTYGRIVKEKNMDIVIKAFIESKSKGDLLYVIGEGPELKNLKDLASDHIEIKFLGFIEHKDLSSYLAEIDCVIISKYEQETGPLTGIEAMASGRIIISSKTGAMTERLDNLGFWFNSSAIDVAEQIRIVKSLSDVQINNLSNLIRQRYLSKYKKRIIKSKYRKIVDEAINLKYY